jgi:hypothetical protein
VGGIDEFASGGSIDGFEVVEEYKGLLEWRVRRI